MYTMIHLYLFVFVSFFTISDGGVIGLTKFFRKRGATAWTTASSNTNKVLYADHLCIDMNQLIHSNVRSKDKLVLSGY